MFGERGLCCCAIVAGGTISVTIRGRLYELGTDTVTGATKILAAADMAKVPGVRVEVEFQKPAFCWCQCGA